VGRFLTRFALLPFGGAFMALFAVDEIVGLVRGLQQDHGEPEDFDELWDDAEPAAEADHESVHLANLYSVGILGVVLLLLLHVPAFRRHARDILVHVVKAFKMVLYDWPTALVRKKAVQRLLNSWPVLLVQHYVVKPLVPAALVAAVCRLARVNVQTTW